MPLGTEVGLGPGDIVLDGDAAPPKWGTTAPLFSARVYCGQTVAHLSNCAALVIMCTALRFNVSTVHPYQINIINITQYSLLVKVHV